MAKQGIGNLSDKITQLINQGQKLFADKNIQKLEKIFENIEKITLHGEALGLRAMDSIDEANKTVVAFRNTMTTLTEQFKVLSADIARELKNANSSLGDIKEVTTPTLKKLMRTVKNFNRVTLRVERTLKRGDYNLKKLFEPVLVDIEIMGNQISDLMKQVEQNPNDLLFKSRKRKKGPGE
jgi:phospholipid/cholesterol/gamma-HCH transport system substrate-binding protein